MFNFQNEITLYCHSSVEILRKATSKFRGMIPDFMHADPIVSSAIKASACIIACCTNHS